MKAEDDRETRPSRDLRARTRAYASAAVGLFRSLPRGKPEVDIIGRQFLRSGTSVAANYREAVRARSHAEFTSKLEVCLQEADESDLWLELLRDDCGVPAQLVDPVLQETRELVAIFAASAIRAKQTSP